MGLRWVFFFIIYGYCICRMVIDYFIFFIIDIKCVKLLIEVISSKLDVNGSWWLK